MRPLSLNRPLPLLATRHASTIPGSAWERVLPSFMFKPAIVADDGFNRWLVPPAAIMTHLSIGSVYSWSLFNEPLTRELGVVASAATDWELGSIVPVFSTSIVCLGLSAAVAGKWLEDVGPRLVGAVSATCWGGGFMVGECAFEDTRRNTNPIGLPSMLSSWSHQFTDTPPCRPAGCACCCRCVGTLLALSAASLSWVWSDRRRRPGVGVCLPSVHPAALVP